MTNSTILKNQDRGHYTSVTGISISSERLIKKTEAPRAIQSGEVISQKNSERERMYQIEQKLSQRSYVSGYKGL